MVLLTLNELWLHGGVASEMHCRYVEPSLVEEDAKKLETRALERPAEASFSTALQGCVPHLGKKVYRHAAWCAPPTPEGATINQDLTDTSHPMAALAFRHRTGCLLHFAHRPILRRRPHKLWPVLQVKRLLRLSVVFGL